MQLLMKRLLLSLILLVVSHVGADAHMLGSEFMGVALHPVATDKSKIVRAMGARLAALVPGERSVFRYPNSDVVMEVAFHGSFNANPYANACGTVSPTQKWCVGLDGWTVFTPTSKTTGTTCATAGTPTSDGSCVIYIAEGGTGTLATCRYDSNDPVLYPSGFSDTIDPTNGGANNSKACPYQTTYMAGTRSGSPDFLLFKRGDCFPDALAYSDCTGTTAPGTNSLGGICTANGIGCNYGRTGLSADVPIVIGAFGSYSLPRPKFTTLNYTISGTSITGNNLAVTSLHSDGMWKFGDYLNANYNAGVLVVGVAAAGVQTVNDAVDNGSGLIRLTVSNTNSLAGPLFVAGVGGVTAANGTWASYTIVDATHVDLTGSTFSGTYTSGGTLGMRQITLPSTPSTSIINSTNAQSWGVLNFSSKAQMAGGISCPTIRVTSISGAVLTTLSNIPANYDIAVGDRIVLVPYNCASGGISFNPITLTFNYVEDVWVQGGGIGYANPGPGILKYYARRNSLDGSFGYANRNQGAFFSDTFNIGSTLLVEENVVGHTGWRQYDNDCAPARYMPSKCTAALRTQYENTFGNPNDQAQNIYDHENCCLMTFQRNISMDSSGTAYQIRSGGNAYNNLGGRSAGGATGGGIVWPNVVSYNVFVDNTRSYTAIMTVTGVAGNTLTFAAVPQSLVPFGGGGLAGATVAALGSGYTNGSQTLTVLGGSCTTQPQISMTMSGGVPITKPVVIVIGACSSFPSSPVSTSGGGGTGLTITGTYMFVGGSAPFNATNPTGINQATNQSFTSTPTTVTIAGPAISASIGDVIYFTNGAQYGYEASTAFTNPATVSVNAANASNVQWNIHTGAIPQAYIGGVAELGWGFQMGTNIVRATGNVIANNYVMNELSTNSGHGGFIDQSQIQSVDGGGTCGGNVRIGVFAGGFWNTGDAITISGTLPSTMNANVTTNVESISGAFLCLASSPFGTGTWTTSTGVINGGITWGANWVYNVTQGLYVLPSTSTAGTPSAFTPVQTAGCPQAAGCPSVEGCMASMGLPATLSDFMAGARQNRKGAYDTRYTAAVMNDCIRSRTNASIPRPVMWLLKRDLDPSSNDNSPMWLDKAV